MKTIKTASMRYVLAPALLALCAGPPQAAAQALPARTMAQMNADTTSAYARDRPLVEAFLAALPTASASSWQPTSFSWRPGDGGPWETITKARFAELISSCAIREVNQRLTLTSGGRAGQPRLTHSGVGVRWTCAGPAAAAPGLEAFFDFEHGGGVDLAPDPETEPR